MDYRLRLNWDWCTAYCIGLGNVCCVGKDWILIMTSIDGVEKAFKDVIKLGAKIIIDSLENKNIKMQYDAHVNDYYWNLDYWWFHQ